MENINPDIKWYSGLSLNKGLTTRCPFASVNKCPRYYQSYAQLGQCDITTSIPPNKDEDLLSKWKSNELWPVLAEQKTSIWGSSERWSLFSNFCPEVSFDTFGLFASSLARFADEIDRDSAESLLIANEQTETNDWRFNWASLTPAHYSDCSLYSPLSEKKPMQTVHFNAPITGQVNVAGESISSPSLNLKLSEIVTQIESSNATDAEKSTAKLKLKEFLEHPIVASIIGSTVGGLIG